MSRYAATLVINKLLITLHRCFAEHLLFRTNNRYRRKSVLRLFVVLYRCVCVCVCMCMCMCICMCVCTQYFKKNDVHNQSHASVRLCDPHSEFTDTCGGTEWKSTTFRLTQFGSNGLVFFIFAYLSSVLRNTCAGQQDVPATPLSDTHRTSPRLVFENDDVEGSSSLYTMKANITSSYLSTETTTLIHK